MDKRSKLVISIFGFVILLIIVIEIITPQPVDWVNSFTASDKIPLGSYVLYSELQDAAHIETIDIVNSSPYTFLSTTDTNTVRSSYIFINSAIDFDTQSYNQLMTYVRRGNTVFIAANSFGKILQDSLAIETETEYQLTEEAVHPVFFTPHIPKDTLAAFKKRIFKTVFKSFDTTKTKALGYYKSDMQQAVDQINFITIKEGKGALYLSTLPEAYTNYYMLQEHTSQYAAATLSFLTHPSYYWDDYLKDGRKYIESPLRFVLAQAPLQWAYYILGIGLLCYVLFRGKREQRIIPVIPPLPNDTLAFTQTIGSLYVQHQAYRSIITQKITYFLERIRTHCYLDTTHLNDEFSTKLAAKTGHAVADTKALIDYIKQLQQQTQHSETDVSTLHKKIEAFTL